MVTHRSGSTAVGPVTSKRQCDIPLGQKKLVMVNSHLTPGFKTFLV